MFLISDQVGVGYVFKMEIKVFVSAISIGSVILKIE
jgi:hypothetical protein